MYRQLFLALTLVITLCKVNAQAESGYMNENSKREARSIALVEEIIHSLISNGLGGLKPIIRMIRNQVREIILDLFFQLIKFLRSILHEYKIMIFKRLGNYTLSDVFHFLFDGIFEFVGGNEIGVYSGEGSLAEASSREQNAEYPNPVLLERLIRLGEKK
ncbi:unnamed protein product [Danaus chrysippus]|uniref:(African queen) hypothetical protein n=1 Tax=Danaus chrysippus TaxID=151541 RepID=A0A8J2QH29_9NEOP|nr:unnamed protein product [Danaus chrysippus]